MFVKCLNRNYNLFIGRRCAGFHRRFVKIRQKGAIVFNHRKQTANSLALWLSFHSHHRHMQQWPCARCCAHRLITSIRYRYHIHFTMCTDARNRHLRTWRRVSEWASECDNACYLESAFCISLFIFLSKLREGTISHNAGRDVHRHQLLEEKLACVGYLDLRNASSVEALLALEPPRF